ncbi:hypothetical protein [Streptomyces sp. NPDC001270]|uniref:hypothetical protein n=1 Tax=Streptomyces sp. NPDC001270 TaxID=3364554 RepID=UPI0036881654
MHHQSDTPDPDEAPGAARITGRSAALRPSVPLYRHMLYGSSLSHALDFLVLAHIHFMCEDGRQFSVDDLVAALRREGITSSNGKGLIGSKAVYESVARLREAGFLHRSQDNGGTFGKVSYTFYEFPASNPHWTPPPLPESLVNDPLPLSGEAVRNLPTGNHVSAGQTASPDKARADKARADRRTGKRRISAGQTASPDRRSAKPSPPHPPEEVNTSSPSSPTEPSRSLPSQMEEEGESFAPKDLHAAESFLQKLTPPHHMGAVSARKYAPLLLQSMGQQGWPSIFEVDRGVLAQELTRDPEGFKRPSSLVPTRIRDLARYEVIAAAGRQLSSPGSGRERCPVHPARYRKGCLDCAMAVPA